MTTFDISKCRQQLRSDDIAKRCWAATFAGQFHAAGEDILADLADLVHKECRKPSLSEQTVKCICRALDSIGIIASTCKNNIDAITRCVIPAFEGATRVDNAEIIASVIQAIERSGVATEGLKDKLRTWPNRLEMEWKLRLENILAAEGDI